MSKSTDKINIELSLDENQVPESIEWVAKAAGDEKQIANAMLLSFWDPKTQNTLKMDLWTKDMTMDDMKKFYFQTFVTLADSFERSTSEDSMADAIRDFADFFGEKLGIIPPSGKFDK